MKKSNQNSEIQSVGQLKEELKKQQKTWLYNTDEERNEEFSTFYFVGIHNNREVLFDTAFYTLNLHYASMLHELADEQLIKLFPDYRGWEEDIQEDDKIEEHRADIIAEMEASDSVKVQEFVEIEEETEEIVVLNVCLNVEEITPGVITKFVSDFTSGNLKLDETLYSFSLEDEG